MSQEFAFWHYPHEDTGGAQINGQYPLYDRGHIAEVPDASTRSRWAASSKASLILLFDPATPGPIGESVPNTIKATALTVTGNGSLSLDTGRVQWTLSNFYLDDNIGTGNPGINFLGGCFLDFDRGNKRLRMGIDGLDAIRVGATVVEMNSRVGAFTASPSGTFEAYEDVTNEWNYAATRTYTIANGAAKNLAAGSGEVLLNDTGATGAVHKFIVGGNSVHSLGGAALFVAGAPAAGKVGLEYDSGAGRYRINNNSGSSVTVSVLTLKSRNFT